VLHGPSKRVIHELGGKLLLLSWPALRPELQFPLTPCTIDTQYLSVSPDGKRVALSGNDGTLAIANVETKLVEACFRAHSGAVLYTAFTEDGQHLVSTSADGHIGIWQLALLDTPPATLLENLANSHGLELREGRVSAKR
jgi:WD40 repeat protein